MAPRGGAAEAGKRRKAVQPKRRDVRKAARRRKDSDSSKLNEAHEQQAATAEVLRIIAGSPGDLQPVFSAILANAARLCEANFGHLQIYENGAFRLGAMHNLPPEYAQAI